jgi:hypothetical protein
MRKLSTHRTPAQAQAKHENQFAISTTVRLMLAKMATIAPVHTSARFVTSTNIVLLIVRTKQLEPHALIPVSLSLSSSVSSSTVHASGIHSLLNISDVSSLPSMVPISPHSMVHLSIRRP